MARARLLSGESRESAGVTLLVYYFPFHSFLAVSHHALVVVNIRVYYFTFYSLFAVSSLPTLIPLISVLYNARG